MSRSHAAETSLPPHAGTSRLHRISELMIRYRAAPADKAGRFKVRDLETGAVLADDYDSEPMASAGARMQAACEIEALFDGADQ